MRMNRKKCICVFLFIYIICSLVWIFTPGSLIKYIETRAKWKGINIIKDIVDSKIKSTREEKISDLIKGMEKENILKNYIESTNGLLSYVTNMNDIDVVYYTPNSIEEYCIKTRSNNNNFLVENKEKDIGKDKENKEDREDTEDADNKDKGLANEVCEDKISECVPVILSKEQLGDFNYLVNNFYVITKRAKLLESDLNGNELMAMNMSVSGDNSKPQILIYHSHSQEKFADSLSDGGDGTGKDIVAVGTYLAEILSEEYGYNVIHCTESFDMVNGVFDRAKAYTYATPAIERILEDNPSIEVVIDLHRDGIPEENGKLLAEYNGEKVAQIMFFNGISRNQDGEIEYLYNKYRKENLAFSFQLKMKGIEEFPGFTRRNYIDAYQYNLHLRAKSILLEAGAQNNEFEEVKNAMKPFAKLLDMVLSGE